ncbi:MAG: hypothetical protein KDC87_17900, partial [Planctomycetes bacterium]|nr:hypothetical protein [Planctomycetota bacterium]
WMPEEIETSSIAQAWTQVQRPGRVPLLLSQGKNLPVVSLPGIGGGLYLGTPSWPVLLGAAMTGVDTEVTLAQPGTIPVSILGASLYLQAYTSIPGQPSLDSLTNSVGIEYKK